MRFGRERILLLLGATLLAPIVVFSILWVTVLAQRDVLNYPLSRVFPWPIACSLKGCITTKTWHQNLVARELFAKTLKEESPSATDALTTTVRHHLVKHTFLRTSISLEDATRYRRRILQAQDEDLVLDTTGLSLREYDAVVLLPLLQQEALRQQLEIETFDELYRELSRKRWMTVLPFSLGWDRAGAKVYQK